jgi:phospholipid/cholesterol/gamma-HCH transport system permease protein
VFADLLGIGGGMIVADLWVDIPPHAYLRQAQWALQPQDFWTGMIKSATFGLVIAYVGCLRGLQARGGAESVGQVTTSAVVTSLTMVIVADAVLTVIFNQYGL